MKYRLKIDPRITETDILITADGKNQEVVRIEEALDKIQRDGQMITIEIQQTIYQIAFSQILYVEVFGDYTIIHTQKRSYKIRQPLYKIEKQLADKRFIRGSRSLIFNLDYVVRFRSSFSGTYLAKMANQQEVTISRRYWKKVKERVFQK